jgi:uncharacterized protein YkwD
LLFALYGYQFAASILRTSFTLPHSLSNVIGFLATAGISLALLGLLFSNLLRKFPKKARKTTLKKLLGTFPAIGEGLIVACFILTLLISFPLPSKVKTDVTESKIGSSLVEETSVLEAKIDEIFGGMVEDSLTSLTTKTASKKARSLSVGSLKLKNDEVSETATYWLVNEERAKNSRPDLVWSRELTSVARDYALDMWKRKYFGHISPEGDGVGVRLKNMGVSFTLAGENLSLAPTVLTAHNGLINSPSHRKNILNSKFKKVGIGVIDNGIYGKIFVQVFTD